MFWVLLPTLQLNNYSGDFLKSYFFDGLIRKHLYLVKRTSVKIEWLTELWSQWLILLWDLCWMWKSFHWNDTMEERELRGVGNWRNSEKLNSSRAARPWKRRWWKKGPKFKHFLLSCFGSIVIAWLLHRKEWIWHQRSQADNARKSVWLYVNISMVSTLPLAAWGAALLFVALSLERI